MMDQNKKKTGGIDVSYVANLCRMDLAEEERSMFQDQLGRVVEYFDQLSKVDVSEVEPMAHAVKVENVFRDDVPGESIPRKRMIANAPGHDGRQLIVPRIVT